MFLSDWEPLATSQVIVVGTVSRLLSANRVTRCSYGETDAMPKKFSDEATQHKGVIMEQMSFDLSQGRTQRDTGASQALVNAGESWHDRASDLALSFFKAAGYEGSLFEEARNYATLFDLPPPPSPNAWGAVCLSLSRRGLIVKTGVYVNSKSVKSHACSAPLWRIK